MRPPWLRPHLEGLIGRYLETVQIDSREVLSQLRRAAEAIRSGADWRGMNSILLIMNDEQRALFSRMQALMTLLEGHATFVMDAVAEGRVDDLDRMRNALRDREDALAAGSKVFQQAIGFETKVKQYATGERFVRSVVAEAGMDGLNRVWNDEANLPSPEEIGDPALGWGGSREADASPAGRRPGPRAGDQDGPRARDVREGRYGPGQRLGRSGFRVSPVLAVAPAPSVHPIRLEVFHFDHRLRADSAKDGEYIGRLADRLRSPFHLRTAVDAPRRVDPWRRGPPLRA